jgi:hypothetical protein
MKVFYVLAVDVIFDYVLRIVGIFLLKVQKKGHPLLVLQIGDRIWNPFRNSFVQL